jgi:hypothetical protein
VGEGAQTVKAQSFGKSLAQLMFFNSFSEIPAQSSFGFPENRGCLRKKYAEVATI